MAYRQQLDQQQLATRLNMNENLIRSLSDQPIQADTVHIQADMNIAI